jgi:hypothetical protein
MQTLAALILGFTLTVSTLVLRSGDRIPVDGEVREQNGVVTFRSAGALYSIRIEEVDLEATRNPEKPPQPPAAGDDSQPVIRFRADAETRRRLIAEMEKNRGGTPAPVPAVLEHPPAPPSAAEAKETRQEENAWRARSRAYQEAVVRAREDLELLEAEIQAQEDEIRMLFVLGHKPRDFTHETTRLERMRERLPQARLALQRAERAWESFREDARRQGVLPGWLR